jgi:hypothetical protein
MPLQVETKGRRPSEAEEMVLLQKNRKLPRRNANEDYSGIRGSVSQEAAVMSVYAPHRDTCRRFVMVTPETSSLVLCYHDASTLSTTNENRRRPII